LLDRLGPGIRPYDEITLIFDETGDRWSCEVPYFVKVDPYTR
jgi:hypothetical protein